MKSEFAVGVHALVFLNHKRIVRSSETVAVNVCTNPTRVRKVLAQLKKAGFVETKEGLDGGYLFCADAEKVNLCMVADALEISFVSANWKSGSMEINCLISSGMAGIMDDLYGRLDHICREELKHVTIADLDEKIFGAVKAEGA